MSETPVSRSRARAAAIRARQGARPDGSPLTGRDRASMDWRSGQAQADADIEGLARDAGAEALIAEMDRAGVPLDEQRADHQPMAALLRDRLEERTRERGRGRDTGERER